MALPSAIIRNHLLFCVYPLFRSLWMSFQKVPYSTNLAGLENYQRVLNDQSPIKLKKYSALCICCGTDCMIISSNCLDYLLKVKHKSFLKRFSFMPYVTSTIAIGIVFVTYLMAIMELSITS